MNVVVAKAASKAASTSGAPRWPRSTWASMSSSGVSGRICTSATKDRSADLLHDVVGHRVVRVHVLDVVGVLDRVDHLEHALGLVLVELDLHARQERGVGGLVVDPGVLQGGADRDHVVRLGDDLEGVAEVVD